MWDESLFAGSSEFYDRGRLPYPPALAGAFAELAELDGSPRLIDVGCGPGTVALRLAGLFAEVVGVDADQRMIEEAARQAAGRKVTNASWVRLRAEELPADLGTFRYATFAQSFHWMDRDLVAARVFGFLEPGGAFVHVGGQELETPAPERPLPHPLPLLPMTSGGSGSPTSGPSNGPTRAYCGTGRPATSGRYCRRRAFEEPVSTRVTGREVLRRSVDDIVAQVFSTSASAPHLYGGQLGAFEHDLRAVLIAASDAGWFSERIPDLALVFYRRP